MSTCEKRWDDAYMAMMLRGGSQAEHYARLLQERKDTPCTLDEQSGAYREKREESR